MKRGIVWFRNDLRVTDNEALYGAAQECDEVIPVYVFDPSYLHSERYGSGKFGARRVKFVLKSLEDLKRSLNALGGSLIVEIGKPDQVLSRIAEEHGVTALFAQKEVTQEEVEVEQAIKRSLKESVVVKFFYGHSLYNPDDIPFETENIPDIFSNFRKKCEKESEVRSIFPIPEKLKVPKALHSADIPELIDLGFEPKPISEKAAVAYKGGEREARKRLENYLWETHNISTYKSTRNGLLGLDYSSKFSGWLAHGCISPRMIYSEVKRYEKSVKKNSSTYWMVFELIWRDYFRYVAMKFGNELFYPGGIRNEEMDWKIDIEKLEAWKKGETGIPFVDANMKELNETGFMSNRGRQIVASYLVKDLKQDWRCGAAYFEQELIDYDVTSNWGNWAYVAGVGNDPRENRYFNILTQANRYDGKGEYIKHWLPELSDLPLDFIHKPWELSDSEKSKYGLHGSAFGKPIYVNTKW
ncbi:DASH family cryptochrome [Cryomorphaceae bacterium 1068]|nr:DASH family cryptochrome [Cryomorphaceae bacterium 1068]